MIARVKCVQTCARGCLYHTHIYINRSRDGIQIACGSMRQYMQRIESSKLYIACDLASSHGMDPCFHYLHYQRWTRRPDINNPTVSSTFLARGKTYKVFQLGAKVEVVVRSALSGNEICKKSVTTDEWYLLYKMQKFSDSDMPMEDHEADLSEPFFLAFQEDVGGCLKVPSCSIEVMEVTCNGIGVASRAMTRTSKIKAITNFCGEDTQIDLPGVPSRLHLETPLRYYSFSQALLNSDSLQLAKKYLKSSVRENSTDKDLKSKVYINLFELNFNASEYLLAGKYLDSALNVIDKKSREFWTLDLQKKGIEKVVNIEANLLLWDSLLKISNYDKEKLNKVLNDVLDSRTLTNTGKLELQPPTTKNSDQTFIKTNFYFYNPQIVSLGKQSFITLWGNRNRDTYWRSIQSSSAKSKGKNIKNPKMEIFEKSVDYTEIYKEIPFTKFEKDSILKLIELSKLELAESYIMKYGLSLIHI